MMYQWLTVGLLSLLCLSDEASDASVLHHNAIKNPNEYFEKESLDEQHEQQQFSTLSAVTYNMWNVMFNWAVRKYRIAQMIRELSPDIIGFQEVWGVQGGDNQVQELKAMLGGVYVTALYAPAQTVAPLKKTHLHKWTHEGVGFLSKYPVVRHDVIELQSQLGQDTTRRVALHVELNLPGGGRNVHVLVVHMSYDKRQQCSNARDVKQDIVELNLRDVMILGDFNTYPDYSEPIQYLMGDNSACRDPNIVEQRNQQEHHMTDVWPALHGDKNSGLTFSNMPSPGLESRPDRILTSRHFIPQSASLHGNGQKYRELFNYHIMWQRVKNVYSTLHDVYHGHVGHTCVHDCGPHASCRCGVCVGGPQADQAYCFTPHCDECTSTVYMLVWTYLLIFAVIIVQLIYAILRILLTKNRRTREKLKHYVGANCCLCDSELYTVNYSTASWRSFLPHAYLSPCAYLGFVIGCIIIFVFLCLWQFGKLLDDVSSVIPEELHVSDHLLLHVTYYLQT